METTDKKYKKYNNRWQTKLSIEDKYKTWLSALLLPIKNRVIRAAKFGDVKRIEKILKNASKSEIFKKKTKDLVKKIVTMTLEDDAKDWREAARKSAKSPLLYELLNKEFDDNISLKKRYDELLERNIKIISTLPEEISRDVVKHVSRKSFQGERHEDIAKEILEFFPRHTRAKENLIARTESSKCKAALTQARSEDFGVYWGIWITSDDMLVRPSHAIMNNVICNYKHPPSPEALAKKAGVYKGKTYGNYLAGEIFNCRCFIEPMVDVNDVRFPAKVYNWKTQNIEMMNKQQFIDFAKKHNSPIKEF